MVRSGERVKMSITETNTSGVDLEAQQTITCETQSTSIQKVQGQWNQTRADVPPLLVQAGVPVAVWQRTFDEACQRNADCLPVIEQLAAARRRAHPIFLILFFFWMVSIIYNFWEGFENVNIEWLLLLFFPQLLCCLVLWILLSKPMREQSSHALAWFRFARDQMAVYRRYGIYVQLLVVPNSCSSGGCKNAYLMGGLWFGLVTHSTPSLVQGLQHLDTLILDAAWKVGRAEYAAVIASQKQNDNNESELKESSTLMAEALI